MRKEKFKCFLEDFKREYNLNKCVVIDIGRTTYDDTSYLTSTKVEERRLNTIEEVDAYIKKVLPLYDDNLKLDMGTELFEVTNWSLGFKEDEMAECVPDVSEEDINLHPERYKARGKHNIECYKAIEYVLENLPDEVPKKYYGHINNIIKYIWRCNYKNGYEDLDKGVNYIRFMFE